MRNRHTLTLNGPVRGRSYAVLPGGGVEPGETFEATAERELAEVAVDYGLIAVLGVVPELGTLLVVLAHALTWEFRTQARLKSA